MSQFRLLSEKQSGTLAQMIQHFFLKSAQVVVGAHSSVTGRSADKWFNLEMGDGVPDDLSLWKQWDILAMPTMVLETVLDLGGLDSNESLVVNGDTAVRTRKKSEIVLERWLVEFDLTTFDNQSTVELPAIYKKLTVLFRSLYTLVRLLPAYGKDLPGMSVRTKVLDGTKTISSRGRIGLSKPLVKGTTGDHLQSKKLSTVLTPIGALRVSVSYRTESQFSVKDNEELVSKMISIPARSFSPKTTTAATATTTTTTTTTGLSPKTTGVSPSSVEARRTFSEMSSSPAPRRRSSLRSVPLFKVASIASSSPPSSHVSPALNASNSSFAASKPIPVTLNRTSSNLSIVQQRHRESSLGDIMVTIGGGGGSGSGSGSGAIVGSAGSRFASSFGSKMRTGSRVRNRSIQSDEIPHEEAITAAASSATSSTAIAAAAPLDDDLDGFMKLLDSKPDLRIASGGGPSGAAGSTSVNYDLSTFKQFQQKNELFEDRSPSNTATVASVSIAHPNNSGSTVGTIGVSHSVPVRRRSSSSSYSPNFHLGSTLAGPTVTPAVTYANRFSVGGMRKPRTSSGSSNMSVRMIESLKQRSYSEQVFDSDDEDKKLKKPANLHQLAMYHRQGSHEDDDDELLFAMSDMTLAKNNQEF